VSSPAVGGTGPFRPKEPWFLAYAAAGGGRAGSWAILDITSLRWLRFRRRPFGQARHGLVSR
jgi:hypothetical protein